MPETMTEQERFEEGVLCRDLPIGAIPVAQTVEIDE